MRLGDEGEDGRDIARRGLGQIVHELLQAGFVEVRGVCEELLAGLEQHLEAQLLEVHLLAHPLLEAHLGHSAVLFVLALVIELIKFTASPSSSSSATTNCGRKRAPGAAGGSCGCTGSRCWRCSRRHLALLFAAFHELVLAHLAALPLLLGRVRGHIHGLPPVVVAPGHSAGRQAPRAAPRSRCAPQRGRRPRPRASACARRWPRWVRGRCRSPGRRK